LYWWGGVLLNRSPLRYPGGKSNITPLIKFIIEKNSANVSDSFTYIEPFAGGAGVAVNLLLDGVVTSVVINDYDKAIYSFWRALKEETDALIELIRRTPVTVEEWYKQKDIYLADNRKYSLKLGFAAFFLNRTNRSGILNAAGPIGGYEQKGTYLIDARFNKEVLIERIQNIAAYKKHIFIYNKEIRSFITQVLPKYRNNAFVYFDPPYFSNGKRLYKNFLEHEDHVEIARYISQNVLCDWILTYDDAPQIHDIYSQYQYTARKYNLNYSVANKGKGTELLLFKSPELLPTKQEIDSYLRRLEISTY
jgi:DNA adenine methylase